MSGRDPDPVAVTLAGDLQGLADRLEQSDLSVQQLWATIELLLDILGHHGLINEGHRRLVQKLRDKSPVLRAKVRLRHVDDKYAVQGPEIDCDECLHLCQARCCALAVELSRQDLEEGWIRWEIDEPYLMKREPDGYCTYLDRQTGRCKAYERRPAMCRQFDCRNDKRIWRDFEAREPAPIWNGVELPALNVETGRSGPPRTQR